MKKSEILQIIREEVQVVLTNEEANEMFDLDPASLLDEMMNEEEEDNWMKDIKSTGECTPATKPGCKGRAKAFAQRAQHGDVKDDNLKKGKNPDGPG
tara:strand:- start:155 stop:445 length:291 start_codon:yes stop_codon:yes gene_type:complete